MEVNTGVDAQADRASDRLCHLALVHWGKARLVAAQDASIGSHIFGDEAKVLFNFKWFGLVYTE